MHLLPLFSEGGAEREAGMRADSWFQREASLASRQDASVSGSLAPTRRARTKAALNRADKRLAPSPFPAGQLSPRNTGDGVGAHIKP